MNTNRSKGQLNRVLALIALTFVMILMLSATALAGGWHQIDTTDNPDGGQWSKSKSPHAGLQTSTNQCRTCHAVHNAESNNNGGGFKLLRNTNRVTECNACHDAASGLSTKRPYQVGEFKQVRGEHSLGSTVIPDSNSSIIFNGVSKYGLLCGNCHSVHGANTVENDPAQGKYADPSWAQKILRKDPGGNGGDASKGTSYDGGDVAGGFTVSADNSNSTNNYAAAKTAFCSDCHNRNSNWDSNTDDDRPNGESHVQGQNVDGKILVNGESTQVANFGTFSNDEIADSGRTGWRLEQNTIRGCVSCHQATTGGAKFPYDGQSSSFPHQSNSSKLLQENFVSVETGWVNERDAKGIRQSNRGINQGTRSLASVDKVCLDCHRNERALGSDSSGVGKTF